MLRADSGFYDKAVVALLVAKKISHIIHVRLTQALQQAIKQYLDYNNANPKPFVWTKSADVIFASIKRFCLRISGSGH